MPKPTFADVERVQQALERLRQDLNQVTDMSQRIITAITTPNARNVLARADIISPAGVPVPLPGNVTDLAVVSDTDTIITLDFTRVDDGLGNPADYEVRFTPTRPIVWADEAASSFVINGAATSGKHQFSIFGLTGNTAYDIQLIPFRGTLGQEVVFAANFSNIVTETTDITGPTLVNWGITQRPTGILGMTGARCLGGISPNVADMKLKFIRIYFGAVHAGQVRLAVYQGGSLSAGPSGATLVADLGQTSGVDIDQFVSVAGGDEALAANTVTWVCFKGNTGGSEGKSSGVALGDYQSARGRWKSTGETEDAATAWSGTFPSGGSFVDWWYSLYLTYEVVAGPGQPATPTGLTATVLSKSSVRHDWTDNANDETSQSIEERNATDGGVFQEIENVAANVVTKTHTRGTDYPLAKVFEARVIAEKTGASDSPPSNIVSYLPNPSPPSVAHPNEPVGFNLIFDQPFDDLPTSSPGDNPAGWSCGGGCVDIAIASDPNAGESPPNVLEGTFPTSHDTSSGFSPFDLEKRINLLAAGATEVYFSWRQKLSTNWQAHRKGNKVMLCWINLGAGDPDGHPGVFTSINTIPLLPLGGTFQEHVDRPLTFSVHTQGIVGRSSGGMFQNTGPSGANAVIRGIEQQFEVHVKLNSVPGDDSDGRVKFWVNGVLIGDHQRLLVGVGQDSGFGLLFEFTPVYGGGESDPITQAMTISVDHIYMSGNQ